VKLFSVMMPSAFSIVVPNGINFLIASLTSAGSSSNFIPVLMPLRQLIVRIRIDRIMISAQDNTGLTGSPAGGDTGDKAPVRNTFLNRLSYMPYHTLKGIDNSNI